MAAGICSPSMVTPSRSFQSFTRSQETSPYFAACTKSVCSPSPPTNRASSDSYHSTGNSSPCSSPNSSSPGSNTSAANLATISNQSHYQRPSTLHGLKHKLHTAAKNIHSPNRRKSVGHIPLSPLARTPSPSPIPASPTRSPSPLAFPTGHQPGSSNTTQSYSPGVCLSTPNNQKKGYGRPKSAEPGSPLLRRALSPDRLHPRSAENKTSISPLVNTIVKVTPRVTIAQSAHPEAVEDLADSFKEAMESKGEKKVATEQKQVSEFSKLTHGISINLSNVGLPNSCGSTQLPRIAEEKDSPTGTKSDDYSKEAIGSSEKVEAERSEKVERIDKAERTDKAEKCEKAERHEKTERIDKTQKSEKAEKTDKSSAPASKPTERTAQSEKSDKTTVSVSNKSSEKTSQTEKSDKSTVAISKPPEKAAQPERIEKSAASVSKPVEKSGASQPERESKTEGGTERPSVSSSSSTSSTASIKTVVEAAAVRKEESSRGSSAQSSQKQSHERSSASSSHKSNTADQKASSKSSSQDASQEGRKVLKKYKVDSGESAGSGGHAAHSTHSGGPLEGGGSGKDGKKTN